MPTQTTQKNSGEKTRKVEWKRVKLGTLLEFKYGKGLPERNRIFGEFPVFGSGGVVGYHNEFLIKAPGIIIGRKGSIGEVYYSKENFYPIDTVFYVENSEEYDLRYSYYLLKNLDLKSLNSDAAVPGLNRNIAHDQMIQIPPLSEQKKIAEVLSAYDDLIEVNQKKIKTLETLAQTLYKEWFVKPVKDGLPDGWEEIEIEQRIKLLSGFAFKSKDYVKNGNYNIVTIKNVHDGKFVNNFDSTINEIPKRMPEHCMLNNGDILLSLTGNVGRVCLVFGENNLLNQRVAKIDSEFRYFAYCLFRNFDFQSKMILLANGSAQQNLSPIQTMKIKILYPGDKVVKDFEVRVKEFIDLIVSLEKQNQNLQKTRDILIPQLVGGRVEVK